MSPCYSAIANVVLTPGFAELIALTLESFHTLYYSFELHMSFGFFFSFLLLFPPILRLSCALEETCSGMLNFASGKYFLWL